jgi:hypothetical protein
MKPLDVEVIDPPAEALEVIHAAEQKSDLHFTFIRHRPDDAGEDLHRRAVITGVNEFDRQFREFHRKFGRRIPPPGLVDAAQVHGQRVSREAFYGHWYDPDTRRAYASGMSVVMRLKAATEPPPHVVGFSSHKGPFIWLDEDDPQPFELDPPADHDAPRGFAEAFLDPAMGTEDERDLYRAFLAVDDVVLNRPSRETQIYHWNGDWHRYFDAGNEGWGSDAWTVARDATTIVVIGASATD